MQGFSSRRIWGGGRSLLWDFLENTWGAFSEEKTCVKNNILPFSLSEESLWVCPQGVCTKNSHARPHVCCPCGHRPPTGWASEACSLPLILQEVTQPLVPPSLKWPQARLIHSASLSESQFSLLQKEKVNTQPLA